MFHSENAHIVPNMLSAPDKQHIRKERSTQAPFGELSNVLGRD